MNTRTRNLALGGSTLFIVVLLVAGRSQPVADPRSAASPPDAVLASPTVPFPTGAPSPFETPVGPNGREMDTYAVDVSLLKGFPPDAAPRDVFDIWVAWDRSVVKRPNMQLLLEGVVLEKIAPPVTEHGPYVAIFLMTRKQSLDFLYAEKYGALSVTRPAG